MMRTTTMALLLGLLAAAVAAPVAAEPFHEDAFDLGRSKADAEDSLGQAPERCMALPGTRHELCEWRFRDREVAWRPLARSIDTNARVGLLCRFDRESGERADCSLHARRSNRSELLQRNRYGKRGLAQSRLAGRVREARESALAAFDRARTLEAVAREVGELPESCREQGSALHCLWRTSSHTPGHGTLAARAGAASTKRIQLRCRFPSDGSGRAAGSCHATVGS